LVSRETKGQAPLIPTRSQKAASPSAGEPQPSRASCSGEDACSPSAGRPLMHETRIGLRGVLRTCPPPGLQRASCSFKLSKVAREPSKLAGIHKQIHTGLMRTVTIRLSSEDFPNAIVAMRDWLDKNRCEPTGYRYDQNEDTVVMLVDFADHSQAKAFAKRFGGKIGAQFTSLTNGLAVSSDSSATTAPAIAPLHDPEYPQPRSGVTVSK